MVLKPAALPCETIGFENKILDISRVSIMHTKSAQNETALAVAMNVAVTRLPRVADCIFM